MKTTFSVRFFAACGAFALVAAVSSGETSLLLDINFGIRYVPPSVVTVPAGEYLRVSAPDLGPLQWKKNGVALPGATGASLILPSVASGDAGTYAATYTDSAMAGRGTQALVLGVGPVQRLLNLSARAQIGDGEKTFIAGFVVANPNGKKIIIRAVGPSLAQFGITAPLAQPAIAIFDKDGKPYANGYVYPAVVGGPTYETDLADSLARAGAFPLPAGTRDVVNMQAYLPGAYTVHVTSANGGTGIVLLEVFEVP